jgi:hypothetical protein
MSSADWETTYRVLANISAFTVIIPIAVFIYVRKSLALSSRILFVYLVFSLFAELTHLVISGKHTELVSVIFAYIEFVCIWLVYVIQYRATWKWRLVLYSVLLIASSVFVYSFKIGRSHSLFGSTYCFVIVILAFIFFLKEERSSKFEKLTDYFFFWYNSAFLLYFGTTLFIFLSFDLFVKVQVIYQRILWSILLVSNILLYLGLTVGAWKARLTQ